MKIAFVWYFPKASQIINNWHDGLRAAFDLIAKKHKVDWYLDRDIPEDEYDAVILWDDSNSEFFQHFPKYHAKKGLCLTTDPVNWENLRMLDVVYCESQPIYEAVRAQGIRAIKAFGTDTDFYKPRKVKKDIDFFYPATFSPWKRQGEIAYLGKQLTCIGTIQPDGIPDLTKCKENGVNVEIGYFPARKILDYYQRARCVVVPAIHGSERTILEAMACGIKPVVTHPENIRTYSYLKELEESGLSPRDFVVKYYSHTKYAEDLLRGICE